MPERALLVECAGARLPGILHCPEQAGERGVLIVVGGPQYRVGSHRQFVLLARALCDAGFPVMRFDHRGIGDSEGDERGFEHIDDDLDAALDAFFDACPALREVVIWGLCDAASAALCYAVRGDRRVCGQVLLNPWVRTEQSQARAHLRHYYRARLLDRDLWRRLLRGELRVFAALRSLAGDLMRSTRGRAPSAEQVPFPERMAAGLQAFGGRTLLILSGDDLTAAEFTDSAAASPAWRKALAGPLVEQRRLEAANHTFARRAWRDQVADWTVEWLRAW